MLCLVLVPLLLAGAVIAVTAIGLDSKADLAVMEAARLSRTTRLYAPLPETPREELSLDTYLPQEVGILWGEENMVWAQWDEIPANLKNAFVAIEDQRFWRHRGVDMRRTLLATLNYIIPFRGTFGGSTITQQLIKNVHGEKEVSPTRKLKEIIRAVRLERVYSKEEILTYYLNIVPMGNGCMGVKSAARYYFGKDLDALDLVECAALAAITNAPARYDPTQYPEENATRRALVLDGMLQNGYIGREEYEKARGASLVLNVTDPIYTTRRNSWYAETVIDDVIEALSEKLGISRTAASTMLYRGGLEIYTLMDPRVQAVMEECLATEEVSDALAGANGGMIVSHPETGDLLGIIGGMGEKEGNRLFHRATGGYYPPGSAIKPLSVYGPALESDLITYATAFDDLPRVTGQGLWPHNSPNVYAGRIGVYEAIAKSKNTVAVDVLELVGKERAYEVLQRQLHFSGVTRGGEVSDLAAAPLALGQLSRGATLREMGAAFGTFANGGVYQKPRSYLAVYDSRGNLLLTNEREEERVWSEETAAIMTKMLEGVVEGGTARRITLKETVDTAGKTGTSGGDKDKWFVGYTPYCVGTIRLGYDDGEAMPAGSWLHLCLWDRVMQGVHGVFLGEGEGSPRSFVLPEGVVEASFCRDSGHLPTPACKTELRGDRREIGYFKRGTQPREECDNHMLAHFDLEDGWGTGAAENESSIEFYVLTLPHREVPEGVHPADEEYTLEYLMGKEAISSRESDTEMQEEIRDGEGTLPEREQERPPHKEPPGTIPPAWWRGM